MTGVRHDPWAVDNPIIVEEDKEPKDIGRYIYPEVYGHPETRQTGY